MKLIEKTAVVTGASSGIGATIAKSLAEEGANVILAARNIDKLERVAKEIKLETKSRVEIAQVDVSDEEQVKLAVNKAIDTFGTIDIYVNNAGVMLNGAVTNGEVSGWERMIDVNVKGTLYGINAVLPQMLERSNGHIINIASVSGQEVTKKSTVYSATKFAVRAISIGLEKELAHTGVRTTNISPGLVDTDLASFRTEHTSNTGGKRKPLDTEDIGRAVVYAVTQPAHVNVNEITVRPV